MLSQGRLYTMSSTGPGPPALWVIDPQRGAVTTVAGNATYPRAGPSERADFTATRVVTSGPRVIFDNPDSLLGVVVFTDGSHAPVRFDKSAAVTVSATGPVAVAGGARTKNPPTTSRRSAPTTLPATPPPSAVAQVSQQVSCLDTTQTPRTPQITSARPSAHAVLVTWSYPLLDEQDCEPDTWVVAVRALRGPQPTPPEASERGDLQFQFIGLRPATPYQVTVTAHIVHQATASAPATFVTVATGPDAPTSVRTASDGKGDWVVAWTPCTSAICYVPASTWTVTGAACGSGFVGIPPATRVSGADTSVTIRAGALLGTSLTFHVQGATAAGLAGDPASDHACTQAWRAPDPSHIAVKASAIPSGSSITATLVVSTDEAPVQAFGSTGTQFTYTVGSSTVGPTTRSTVEFRGLAAGTVYQPEVTVTPIGHPGAAVTVNGTPFTQTVPWPSDLHLLAAAAVDPTDPDEGTLTASFPGAPAVPLAASGVLTCGSVGHQEGPFALSSSHVVVIPIQNLDNFGGACALTLTLAETSTREYGVASPPMTYAFSVGTQVDPASFSFTYASAGPAAQDLTVTINGTTLDEGINWNLVVTSPRSCVKAANAYASPDGPPTLPVTIDLGTCDLPFQAPITVTASYTYLGANVVFPVKAANGPPPTTTTTTTTIATTTTTAVTTTSTSSTTSTSTTSTIPRSSTSTSSTTVPVSRRRRPQQEQGWCWPGARRPSVPARTARPGPS